MAPKTIWRSALSYDISATMAEKCQRRESLAFLRHAIHLPISSSTGQSLKMVECTLDSRIYTSLVLRGQSGIFDVGQDLSYGLRLTQRSRSAGESRGLSVPRQVKWRCLCYLRPMNR